MLAATALTAALPNGRGALAPVGEGEEDNRGRGVADAAHEIGDRVPKLDLAYRGRRKYFDIRLALPMSI